ncbi:regulator of (H+)-ATPase in vacuolar membrane, partial [Ascosphaera pollenicola]
MQAILPGRPPPKLQAFGTALWDGVRIVVYITGRALVILGGPRKLLQTIYVDEVDALDAVAVDEATGQIAVSSKSSIFVYQPFNIANSLKVRQVNSEWRYAKSRQVVTIARGRGWSLSHSFSDTDSDPIRTLSWGIVHELLASTASHLVLWNTSFEPRITFKSKIANPVKFAEFSCDGHYIASSGEYDCLVKIWHRCTFDSEETSFQVSYLRHAGIVADVYWRRPCFHDDSTGNVLYIICSDNQLRIYNDIDVKGSKGAPLVYWTSIDMGSAIQPRIRDDSEIARRRYAFILDCREFAAAVEGCEKRRQPSKQRHVLEHIVEIAKRSPDIVVILDSKGHMSVWGVPHTDEVESPPSEIFNISHVEGVDISLASDLTPQEDYTRFLAFAGGKLNDKIVMLAHHFDGRIEWLESEADVLFDPSSLPKRLRSRASWCGHQGTVKKIVRDISGKTLVSRTDDNKATIWHQERSSLVRQSTLLSETHIHRTCLLDKGNLLVNLHHDCVMLWDVGSFRAKELATCAFDPGSKPLCVLQLPRTNVDSNILYVAAVTANMSGIAWEITLDDNISGSSPDDRSPKLSEFCRFQ